ncbi:PepSY domain-containing protein [Flavobacterium sp. H122]|uniref:PepSY domain-containing protein n=1 Tax=Flavobacterium sp. H122 TaxID=2529860 RepID=UPI0010AA2C39|nr:PepSY domain-containing protein [Flavobacterium sp. H122]
MQNNNKKKNFQGKLKRKLKQKVYKWHKIFAIIIVIPLLLWCLSGIMHPLMAHFFKPKIANEILTRQPFDSGKIKIGIKEALLKNNIAEIKNFRLVAFNGNQFYQIKTLNDSIIYLDTRNADFLSNGDKLYGEWLARYFLDDKKSAVKKQELITRFDSQYKYVNRYIPVHKVSFEREDEIQVYVETTTDKLATFNPKSRQLYIWFFNTFHNWSFLDVIANEGIKIYVMLLLLSVIVFSAVSGLIIYGFFWKQFKKVKTDDSHSKWRKYHRQTGLALAFFTVMFAFSGAFHAFQKLDKIAFEKMVYEPKYTSKSIGSEKVEQLIKKDSFKNVSLIKYRDTAFYRVQLLNGKNDSIVYINAVSSKLNNSLDNEYAKFLAQYFNGKMQEEKNSCCEMEGASEESVDETIKETAIITDFKNREYGFVNKRLPVVKVAFESDQNKTLFIETATSRLAAFVTDSHRVEGYSFSVFHKFLFMEWAGKDIRDLTMVIAALGVVLVGILGLALLFKKK